MKRTIAVLISVLIILSAGTGLLTVGASEGLSGEKNAPDVMLIDEFMNSETAEYTEPEGGPILTLDLISDTHIGAKGTSEILATAINTIEAEKDSIDGVIVAGDLTDTGNEEEFSEAYSLFRGYTGGNMVTANGNHDYGRSLQAGKMRPHAIKYRNELTGVTDETDYYSTEIGGYKYIVIGNENNKPNSATISDEQLEFINRELEDGTSGGRPVFVICHWPMRNTHGERLSWPIIPGGALSKATSRKLLDILSSYDNVFYISGHLHAGLNGRLTRKLFKACCVEQHEGVTCINIPTLGKTNHLGLTESGTGMRLTVYSDKAVIEGRNYLTGEWLDSYIYETELKNASPASPGIPGPETGDYETPVMPEPAVSPVPFDAALPDPESELPLAG